jgi:hypothetical protein
MLRGTQRRRGGRSFLWLLIGLIIGGGAGAAAVFLLKHDKSEGLPGSPRLGQAEELALIPTDALGFVHIRARDLWKSEILTELRQIVDKAGPEAHALLDEGFSPSPSTLDRVTLVLFQNSPKPAVQPGAQPKQPKGPPVPPGKPAVVPQLKNAPDTKPLIDFPDKDKIEPVGIFTFTAPFDESKVRTTLVPGSESKEAGAKTYWQDTAKGMAVYFPSNTVLVAGTPLGVQQFVTRQASDGKQPEGPLTGALNLASSGKRQVVAAINARHFHVNLHKLKDEIHNVTVRGDELEQLAVQAEPLLHTDAYAISLSLMGKDDSKIDFRAYFKDEKEAEEGEKAVRTLAEFAHRKLAEPMKDMEAAIKGQPNIKGQPEQKLPAASSKSRPLTDLPQAMISLFGLGAMKKIDEYLLNPPLERSGKELVVTFEMPSFAVAYTSTVAAAIGLMFPAVQKVREAAATNVGSNHLTQMALAMHGHNDANGHLPVSSPNNKSERIQLSWRVQILPYIEQSELFWKFKLDEPWDSPHNKKLIELMPKIYECPRAAAPPGQTYYKVFSGGGAIFGPGKKSSINFIPDGTANTILIVEGGEPVIWTKPDDIEFDPAKPVPNLGLPGIRQINVAMANGSIHTIDLDRISEKTLKNAIMMADGEVLGSDW